MDLIRRRGELRLALVLGLVIASTAKADAIAEGWVEVLARRVTIDGEVTYRALAMYDRERLATYVGSLATKDLSELDRDETVAFWLNAYNALVLYGVIQGYDPGVFEERAELYHWLEVEVAGTPRTLDEIGDLLSGLAMADPRIHFAACNGTRGAPPLADEPYVADRLDAQLARAARRFVNGRRWNRFDVPRRRVELSPIFGWHREAFEQDGGSILEYVSSFLPDPKVASILTRAEIEIIMGEYDWSLNAAPGHRPGDE